MLLLPDDEIVHRSNMGGHGCGKPIRRTVAGSHCEMIPVDFYRLKRINTNFSEWGLV
jgi:hypothetical protein